MNILLIIIAAAIFLVLYFKCIWNTKREFYYNVAASLFAMSFSIYNFVIAAYFLAAVQLLLFVLFVSDSVKSYNKYFKFPSKKVI